MSPAKATRPGFRQSISATVDSRRADQAAINLFHPIYHAHTYPIGCRIDIERLLPPSLDNEDAEELIDNFSEPPVWVERFSPLAVQVGDQVIRGKNASDLMIKVYRLMFDLYAGIGRFIENSLVQTGGGQALHYPFMSLAVDPDTMHRLIETDYESGETTYSNLMKLIHQGIISPCLTTPFHVMLPLLDSDAEIRLCVRASFVFYVRIIRLYQEFLKRHDEENLLVLPFWLPEGGYSVRVLRILEEEFKAFCKKEKIATGHLVLLLDNHQASFHENDVLMKSWNQVAVDGRNGNGNGHGNGAATKAAREKNGEIHPGIGNITVMFRDRAFSDWVIHANPSVKKLLDRTIAKVDSDINSQNVHYGWAHFEEIEAITYNPRSIINFQQKLVKLTELGYLPLSPDFYVRGKLRGEFGCTLHEPQMVQVVDQSVGNGWDLANSANLSRWLGLQPNGNGKPALAFKPYTKTVAGGAKVERAGYPCWKIAWDHAYRKCRRAVIGNLETLEGGMAAVLGELSGQSAADKARRNVNDFLANYTYVYWREHFIQHDLAEADINILELGTKHLRAGLRDELEETEAAKAGAAAQAIYFALDAGRSVGTGFENPDQRAYFQNVVLLTLALCNAMYVYHWNDDVKSARKLLNLLKTELLDFESAWERYRLTDHGVTRQMWHDCLKPEAPDSTDNVVRRAALRVAARHLRPLGYIKEFSRQDQSLTTNVGHLWSIETGRENFCYENPLFCGIEEG